MEFSCLVSFVVVVGESSCSSGFAAGMGTVEALAGIVEALAGTEVVAFGD
jgi:hypothetical protein